MASHFRVVNVSNGFHIKRTRAERGVAECAYAWVEYGVSVRNLFLAESVAARAIQEKTYEPLPYAELPGLTYNGPLPQNFDMIQAAHDWSTEHSLSAHDKVYLESCGISSLVAQVV